MYPGDREPNNSTKSHCKQSSHKRFIGKNTGVGSRFISGFLGAGFSSMDISGVGLVRFQVIAWGELRKWWVQVL